MRRRRSDTGLELAGASSLIHRFGNSGEIRVLELGARSENSLDFCSSLTRLSQLDPDLGNFADGLNGNWLIGLVRSRKKSRRACVR